MDRPAQDCKPNPYHQRMLRVLDHIQAGLDRELGLEELADVAQLSPFHFHRLFSALVGETVMAHVRRLRLERAAYLLRYSEQKLIDIAMDSGYEAQESFTRAFKSSFGDPPARYRRLHRPLPSLPAPAGVHYDPDLGASTFQPIMNASNDDLGVRIETRPALHGVRIRHVGPYDQVGPCFERLSEWVGERGLFGPQTMVFGLAHDDPAVTAPEHSRYDACLALGDEQELELEEPVETVLVEAGEFATWLHEGAYSALGSAYERLVGSWLPTSGRELRHAPALELYLGDPQVVEPEDLQTLVCLPLVPLSQGGAL